MRVLVAAPALCVALGAFWLALGGFRAVPPQSPEPPATDDPRREGFAAEAQTAQDQVSVTRSAIEPPQSPTVTARPAFQTRLNHSLVVRTVDQSGRAVPEMLVRLYLRVMVLGQLEERWTGQHLPRTDADGFTQIHLEAALGSRNILKAARLSCVFFGGESTPVDVSLFDVPPEPVELVVPPFGSMDIVLLGPDGRPWDDSASRHLAWVKPVSAPDPETFSSSDSVDLGSDGHASVSPVLCGERFRIVLQHLTSISTIADGPRYAGERVRVELRMSAELPILTGTVVQSDGPPVHGDLQAWYEFGTKKTSATLRTDRDGRFRVPLREEMVGETLTIKLSKPDERSYWRDRLATHTTDVPVRAGLNEIGELVLAETPLVVSGRVEYSELIPLVRSLVDLDPRGARTARLDLAPQLRLDFARAGTPPGDPSRWEWDDDLVPQAMPDGRFAVHGHPKSRLYRLRLMKGGEFLPIDPVEFTVGTEDLVIPIEKGGEVTTTLLGDSSELLSALRIRLVPVHPRRPADLLPEEIFGGEGEGFRGLLEKRVTSTWRGLAAGLHHLTIGYPGTPPIVDHDDIDVPRGSPAVDPRLTLDLRGRLRKIRVRVLDVEGKPLDSGQARITIRGRGPETDWYSVRADIDGRVALFVSGPVTLIVSAHGYRTLELSGAHADTTVFLMR